MPGSWTETGPIQVLLGDVRPGRDGFRRHGPECRELTVRDLKRLCNCQRKSPPETMSSSKAEDDDKFELFGPPTGQKAERPGASENAAGNVNLKPDAVAANASAAQAPVVTASYPKSDSITTNYHSASSQISTPHSTIGSSSAKNGSETKVPTSIASSAGTKGTETHQHVELYETVGEMFSAAVQSLYGKIFGVKPEESGNIQVEVHTGTIELYEKPSEMFVAALESLQGKISRGEPTTLVVLFCITVLPIYYFSSWRQRPVVLERRESNYVERLTHE